MKFNITRSLFFVLLMTALLAGTEQVMAQTRGSINIPSGKVGQMSDQQIMEIMQQSKKAGLSESETMTMMMQKGMPSSEVSVFKRRLMAIQNKTKTAPKQVLRDSSAYIKDSTWVTETPAAKKSTVYYGFDFFNNPDNSFEPNMRITTPQNYVLGPDDELAVDFTGINEASATVNINPDGNIQLPYAGNINISGLTIEQATLKIKNRMSTAYPALKTGKTSVFLTLMNFKSIRVTVVGEVQKPGLYTVSSLASFFNVLYKASGPAENGSLRRIELIRNNRVIETIDFYSFLQKGLLGKEIRLQDQDVIHIPLYTKRVSLGGEVRRPAVYELLEKETLNDLLQYGGGAGDVGLKDGAKIVQIGDKDMHVRDVSAADFKYFIPRNGDSVYIEKVSGIFTNRVVLNGEVYRPGTYELTDQLSLSKLIMKADGLKENAFLNRGFIKRRRANTDRELIPFNTADIISGKQPDIMLVKEDSVFILAKDDLTDVPTITVGGNVRMPGVFQYRAGLSVEDVILMAGGFTNDAANHKVEISRLEKNRADTLANKLIDIITLDIDSSFTQKNGKTLLEPLDYIFVPRLLNYRELGTVKVRGEILYSGDYALEKRNETIQEVIRRAGGLSPFASMGDVQVFRKGLRVGTNLVSDGSEPGQRFLLQPDDSIFVPKNEPFIEVQGAVFNPQIVSYRSTSFLSYISDVGGVTDNGNLRKAYIRYSNGINRKIHHFLFFRRYPKVLPGSKIIVPEKTDIGRRGLSIIEVSTLLGSLATIISLIAVLKN